LHGTTPEYRWRNKAIENATGDFVAFIDDDEFPTAGWLWNLFTACSAYDVAGVLGPVRPHFSHPRRRGLLSGWLKIDV
jgi:succinoglycan biosynthesis protein ExoM